MTFAHTGKCPVCSAHSFAMHNHKHRWVFCSGCANRGQVVLISWSDGWKSSAENLMERINEKILAAARLFGWPGRPEDFLRIAYGHAAPDYDSPGKHRPDDSAGVGARDPGRVHQTDAALMGVQQTIAEISA